MLALPTNEVQADQTAGQGHNGDCRSDTGGGWLCPGQANQAHPGHRAEFSRGLAQTQKLPPQSVKEKFGSTYHAGQLSTTRPFIFVGHAGGRGTGLTNSRRLNSTKGAAGYGSVLTGTPLPTRRTRISPGVRPFILPAALHQDSRYYTLGHGGIPKRALYAFDRTLITRSDRGGETFNFSEVVGAGAAPGISTTYYPGPEKTWTKTGQRWLTNVIIDGATYVFQEFWPDINNAVFHQKD